MVTVIGKDDSLKKRVTCRHCASILEYWPADIQSGTSTDFGGGRDTYYFIICVCSKKVNVRN